MQTARIWGGVIAGLVALTAVALAQHEPGKPAAPMPKHGDKDTPKPAAKDAPAPAAKGGSAAPDFTLTDTDGKAHKLSDLKDKVVVLEWLNKECPWSVKGRPVIQKTLEKYKDKSIVWIGIDSTYGRNAADEAAYRKEEKLIFPILMDEDGKVGHLYGARTPPHLFVIDKGKLVYAGGLHNDQQGTKSKDEFRNYVEEALDAVLAGKAVPVAETAAWGCPVKYNKAAKP